jgi:hypothetical protein
MEAWEKWVCMGIMALVALIFVAAYFGIALLSQP